MNKKRRNNVIAFPARAARATRNTEPAFELSPSLRSLVERYASREDRERAEQIERLRTAAKE
jgi:hypothetical protein